MQRTPTFLALTGVLATSLVASTPAQAVNVTLAGTVINTCILTLATPGVLTTSNDGTTLGSAQTGGVPAALVIAATGTGPTLTFGAPTVASGASTAGATTEIAYTSLSGANQAYTQAQTTHASNLIDTFTVNARVTKANGFGTGLYTVTTVVTCAQP